MRKTPPTGPRSRVRRQRERADYDAATVHAVLDAGLICHVGFVADDQPFVIPMLYVRDGGRLLLHGSVASRLMQQLAAGRPACVSVTLLDGVVLARSAFHSSMNYRSVVAFGRARAIKGADKRAALDRLLEGMIPGRSADARPMTAKEMAATTIVEFTIDEAAAKTRSGPPDEPAADRTLPIWGGVIPLRTVRDKPQPDGPAQSLELPDYVRDWPMRGG